MKSSPDEAEIRAMRVRHNAAIAARDLAGVMAIVAADYVLVTGDGGIIRSREAVLQAWMGEFANPDFVTYVRTPDRVEVGDGHVAESGKWKATYRSDAKTHGRYLVHWRREPDGWRTVADLYVTLG
jgi:ketosteroid isomerase-like protein